MQMLLKQPHLERWPVWACQWGGWCPRRWRTSPARTRGSRPSSRREDSCFNTRGCSCSSQMWRLSILAMSAKVEDKSCSQPWIRSILLKDVSKLTYESKSCFSLHSNLIWRKTRWRFLFSWDLILNLKLCFKFCFVYYNLFVITVTKVVLQFSKF